MNGKNAFATPIWPYTLLFIIALHFGLPANGQSTLVAQFAVHAGKYERVNTPVSASLESVPNQWDHGRMQLYEITNGMRQPIASQATGGSLAWILNGKTKPGSVRTFEWCIEQDNNKVEAETAVHVEDDNENLNVTINGKPVLSYRYALQPVPDGVDSIYSRQGGFIHPLVSPGGEILSRIQPPDHYHHYAIWNPWTRTEFEGRKIDFWNLADGQGTVRSLGVLNRKMGPILGGFSAQHNHIDLTAPEGEKVAISEQWTVNVWNADTRESAWVVDFVSTLNPATSNPVTIEAYRYQGFSLRATEKWDDDTAVLLTSDGFDKSNANATRARWIDVNGISEVAEGTSGVLFLTHPANHDFPERLRIWPVGANGGKENVYINFNPAQDTNWVLHPGTSHVLSYRMILYDGKISSAKAEQYWADFADPPRVEVFTSTSLQQARVLVYTKNGEGYVHDNIQASVKALQKLGDKHGFTVHESDNPNDFTIENLSTYDALVFSNTNNTIFDSEEQRDAFKTYINNGGGFVGIHSASGSERNWPWFSKLLGGNFERHAPQQDFTVSIVDRSHPSTTYLPNTWEIIDDESYYLDELNPGIRILVASNLKSVSDKETNTFPGNIFGNQFPVSWYQEFDGGRQWYTSLGHRPEHYNDPLFMRHILGGIQWAINGQGP